MKIIKHFHWNSTSRNEAIEFMKRKKEPYKVELIEDLPEDAECFYRQKVFTDLLCGTHTVNTKRLLLRHLS